MITVSVFTYNYHWGCSLCGMVGNAKCHHSLFPLGLLPLLVPEADTLVWG